jgi:hypothetical protein
MTVSPSPRSDFWTLTGVYAGECPEVEALALALALALARGGPS